MANLVQPPDFCAKHFSKTLLNKSHRVFVLGVQNGSYLNGSWRCRARMICSCGRIGRPQICTRSSANRSLHYVQSSQITGSQLKDLPYSFRPTEPPHGRWRSMSLARMRSNMALSKRKWARFISSGARRSEDDCAFAGANLAARPLPFPGTAASVYA